ncbi:PPK2 family polyphosphate kinase [Staphylococcus carnosus]|uniref:PPK2 family polyphosphate kinase n=1 Tax=Staphylococcus carnosus TaxID=1281 RepID=UPI000AECECC9|nr:PPK2 family polyphosphate kinase [Staphylococcus carnosus]
MEINVNDYKVPVQKEFKFKDYAHRVDTQEDEKEIRDNVIPELVDFLQDLHLRLFAEEKDGIMVVLQAMDAAGKDEAISYIFSNLNAQGLKTTSFGQPSEEEEKHDYLWRLHQGKPQRGEISLLNRSYYEDVIVTRVHDLLGEEHKDQIKEDTGLWELRYRQINDHERYLEENGFHVIKFFFNMSKEAQRDRLLERMKDPKKNWEFSFNDVKERQYWENYQEVFADMINKTSTSWAPWYVLPADNPWYARAVITKVMIEVLEKINPQFPEFTDEEKEELDKYIRQLENE